MPCTVRISRPNSFAVPIRPATLGFLRTRRAPFFEARLAPFFEAALRAPLRDAAFGADAAFFEVRRLREGAFFGAFEADAGRAEALPTAASYAALEASLLFTKYMMRPLFVRTMRVPLVDAAAEARFLEEARRRRLGAALAPPEARRSFRRSAAERALYAPFLRPPRRARRAAFAAAIFLFFSATPAEKLAGKPVFAIAFA